MTVAGVTLNLRRGLALAALFIGIVLVIVIATYFTRSSNETSVSRLCIRMSHIEFHEAYPVAAI